jgi:hypothetical protein
MALLLPKYPNMHATMFLLSRPTLIAATLLLSIAVTGPASASPELDATYLIERLESEEAPPPSSINVESLVLITLRDTLAGLNGTMSDGQQVLELLPAAVFEEAERAIRAFRIRTLLDRLSPQELMGYATALRAELEPPEADTPDPFAEVARAVNIVVGVATPAAIANHSLGMTLDLNTPEMIALINTRGLIRFANPIARRQAIDAIEAGLD